MKTKDFIKMLQEEDPTGECHIRGYRGVIRSVTSKPGYWDGPYDYIEEDKDGKLTWVASTRESKIDIYEMDLYDFAERYGGDWEEVKKHIRVEYDYLDDGERKEQFLKHAKEECDQCKEIKDHLYNEGYIQMIENAKDGWKWFQNKDVDKNEKPNLHKYYTWKIYNKWGKEQMSTIHNTESIMKSGDWEKVDNNNKKGYYQWIYKN